MEFQHPAGVDSGRCRGPRRRGSAVERRTQEVQLSPNRVLIRPGIGSTVLMTKVQRVSDSATSSNWRGCRSMYSFHSVPIDSRTPLARLRRPRRSSMSGALEAMLWMLGGPARNGDVLALALIGRASGQVMRCRRRPVSTGCSRSGWGAATATHARRRGGDRRTRWLNAPYCR